MNFDLEHKTVVFKSISFEKTLLIPQTLVEEYINMDKTLFPYLHMLKSSYHHCKTNKEIR
jgi:hypothetical protein